MSPRPVPHAARRVVPVLLALALVVACTPTTTTPPPQPAPVATAAPGPSGVRVGVVLMPANRVSEAESDRSRGELELLARSRRGEIASLRVVVPDTGLFAADVAALLADDGYDLVCVFGESGLRALDELVARFPATRFCVSSAGAAGGAPADADVFVVDHGQLGQLLGVAAAALADGGRIGLVRSGDRQDRLARREGLRTALATRSQSLVLDLVSPEPADDVLVAEHVTTVTDAELDVLVVDGEGEVAGTLADLLSPSVLMPATSVGGSGTPQVAVTWRVRVDAVVAAAVTRMLAGEAPGEQVLGLTDGAFVVQTATSAPASVRSALDVAAAELRAGVPELRGG